MIKSMDRPSPTPIKTIDKKKYLFYGKTILFLGLQLTSAHSS